jgi:hypothetical protein
MVEVKKGSQAPRMPRKGFDWAGLIGLVLQACCQALCLLLLEDKHTLDWSASVEHLSK